MFAGGGTEAVLSLLGTMGVFGMLIGALIGGSQWMYLRWRIRGAIWWIPATAVGWGVGLPFAVLVNFLAGSGFPAIIYGVFVGAAVGLGQWTLLKRRTTPAGRWILMSVVALPIGIMIAGLIEQGLRFEFGANWEQVRWLTALSAGMAGLVVGLLTGVTLLVLLANRKGNP
jgi:hypothetical protein